MSHHPQKDRERSHAPSRPTGLLLLALAFASACSLQSTPVFDPDGDGILSGDDCDDLNAAVGMRFEDADGDGHGGPTVFAPEQASDCLSTNTSAVSDDCNDDDSSIYPGAVETCDGVDQSCDQQIDENAVDASVYYPDVDKDDYGDATASGNALAYFCPQKVQPGYVSNADDCNDNDKDINPEEVEVCDTIDQNCDGSVDENPRDGTLYYPDVDGDNFGASTKGEKFCPSNVPPHYASVNGDCNDNAAAVYPGAVETCDGADNDCDGSIDNDPIDGTTYYQDLDLDGFGNSSQTIKSCQLTVGISSNANDCNDGNAQIHPGATELCNGRDEDCNGVSDNGLPDTDGSGFPDCTEVAYIASTGFVENGDIQGCDDSTNLLAQQAQVEAVLNEQGLHLVAFQDNRVTGLDADALARYPLVIYDDGGWTDSPLPASVAALHAARAAGAALLFMGDDLVSQAFAYSQNNSSRDLYDLLWISQWKAGGTTQRGAVILDVSHPVLDGPAGRVMDFSYYGDMDVSIPAGDGEIALANIFGSQNPAILAAELDGQRTVVMLPSSYATVVNCPVSNTDGLVQLRNLLSNAVVWLIDW